MMAHQNALRRAQTSKITPKDQQVSQIKSGHRGSNGLVRQPTLRVVYIRSKRKKTWRSEVYYLVAGRSRPSKPKWRGQVIVLRQGANLSNRINRIVEFILVATKSDHRVQRTSRKIFLNQTSQNYRQSN